METLSHRLIHWADHHPHKIAIIQGHRSITYKDFITQSMRIAEQFTAAGWAEKRVAVMLENSIELALIYYAAFGSGVTLIPLSLDWKEPQINHVIALTTPETIINNDNVKHCMYNTLHTTFKNPEPSKPAALFATSGSTGDPKIIIHSHESLLAMAESIAEGGDITEADKFLVSEPMINASGCTHLCLTLAKGGTAILTNGIVIPTFKKLLRESKPTIICVMGKGNLDILHAHELNRNDFHSVRFNFTGGDKITKEFMMQFENKTGIKIRYSYGMSECLVIATNKSQDITKLGSVGVPSKDLVLEIRDNKNKVVKPGESGEIWVKGKNIMQGYWKNPTTTQITLVNGWLRTGDLAYQDNEGYLWMIGRTKNIIIRDGENISPYEIEEVLATHPSVKIAGVVGIEDAEEGQVPYAAVELISPCSVSVEELENFLTTKLSHLSMPKYIKIVQSLPRTSNGKIDRNALKELIQSAHILKNSFLEENKIRKI